jgi:hypothetical protein
VAGRGQCIAMCNTLRILVVFVWMQDFIFLLTDLFIILYCNVKVPVHGQSATLYVGCLISLLELKIISKSQPEYKINEKIITTPIPWNYRYIYIYIFFF